ncbi:metallophosphoesterase [Sinisalibacter lacisalsi]|uniref:Ser/threonine protein phosphatase n=1 Tax=Sinisalibacter lacisalsi TaxID=1526570 RepID=A0ABQ1QK84_9RHOB|nr:metallophosphoesterase [Sinisalibacter lacisalsi]GGD29920.1 ser/threonine protein phosphatase [Sinisalibacter lacisalsi]
MKLLSRIFRGAARPVRFDAALAPDERLAVVGDIHGCAALLDRLLDLIGADAPARLVFVGDYIDRGEDSAGVLERLHALARDDGAPAMFLKGNHEEMMLRFLDDPGAQAAGWLRNGGLQTLASYGIGGLGAAPDESRALKARDDLARALGPEKLAWLRGLPLSFVSGNVAVVHAAANPSKSIDAQSEQALLWGHPDFARTPRRDGLWVVHGHTIVDAVTAEAGRIGVDTGAYATGRLSAAVLERGDMRVLTASR